MKLNTSGRALFAAVSAPVIAALPLAACGNDDNTGPTAANSTYRASTGSADCAGKKALTAEGSTAQQNAIALFNQAGVSFARVKTSPITRPVLLLVWSSSSLVKSTLRVWIRR